MPRRRFAFALIVTLAALVVFACGRGPATLTILHFNDVYEIDAVEGGKFGGLARVASVLADLKRTHAPVLTTLGGDYLSPSAIGVARVDGQPIAGRQMVDVLNALGLDVTTFGNHEFDIPEAAFHARMAEEKFKTVSTNVTDANGRHFDPAVETLVVPIRAGGRDLRIGFFGLTVDMKNRPWVKYGPLLENARRAVDALRGHTDAIVALTHVNLSDDQDLVTAFPDIDLVLGAHEHENWMIRRGAHFTPIVKADSNVRSVAIVTMTFGPEGSRPAVDARLKLIDAAVPKDPAVDAIVQRWTTAAFDAFKRDGFSPEAPVVTIPEPLDGRESVVRNRPGNLSDIVAASLVREVTQADVAMFSGGSIRIDDVLPAGPIREYDIIRILPLGGKVLKATFDGSLLASVLDIGLKNQGKGGYLQTWGATHDGDHWLVQGKPLKPSSRYAVALMDFLLSGGETNLGFLTRANPHVHDVQEFRDVRRALTDELKARYK